ncbi:MAG: GTPase domain-containing protein [Burkholderiaceae bacterium]
MSQVWDRLRDRPLYSSQQALGNVREVADVVLYLVSAAEDPAEAAYVDPEMRILGWIGKPVVVLLNQTGRPRSADAEAADLERWRERMTAEKDVRAVIALDAFARCWIQEFALFDAIGLALPDDERRTGFARLVAAWRRRRVDVFTRSIELLAGRIAAAARDRVVVRDPGITGRLRALGATLGLAESDDQPALVDASKAMARRLDESVRASTDRLIDLHGLEGSASGKVLVRLAEHYAVTRKLDEGKAAVLGGLVTGALAGLKADIATGGFTLGGGLIAGGVLGALGGAGIARGYNMIRGATEVRVAWNSEVLERLVSSSLLGYLAVAHFGRGRGQWREAEHPALGIRGYRGGRG